MATWPWPSAYGEGYGKHKLSIWVIMCRRPIEDLLRGALATLTLCSVVVKEGRGETREARARTEERTATTLIVESEGATGLDWADRG